MFCFSLNVGINTWSKIFHSSIIFNVSYYCIDRFSQFITDNYTASQRQIFSLILEDAVMGHTCRIKIIPSEE